MSKVRKIMTDTAVMTAVSLIMRTAGVSFSVSLTARIGSAGMGLFQLILTVYSMAVTFSCAGIRLATTRVAVEINSGAYCSMSKSICRCLLYALCSGLFFCALLMVFADAAAQYWLREPLAAYPLRILALSLPFVAVSNSMGGYFTAVGLVPQHSFIQMIEQGIKISCVFFALSKTGAADIRSACTAVAAGMTASEIASMAMAYILFRHNVRHLDSHNRQQPISLLRMLRVALPDACGTCARSILLTVEHLLIPRGFEKSGADSKTALSAYGNIHSMVLPVLLYPSAVLTSLSALLVPELASLMAHGNSKAIESITSRVIRLTLIFAIATAGVMLAFSRPFSICVYGTGEATHYLRVLAPLVPVMYLDMTVDGMLKGLDQQLYSMRYNIFDSALCVVLVIALLPSFAEKGYIFILYISEIINFYLSLNRLIKTSGVRIDIKDIVKSAACTAVAVTATAFVPGGTGSKPQLAVCISISVIIYGLLISLLQRNKEPLLRLPGLLGH